MPYFKKARMALAPALFALFAVAGIAPAVAAQGGEAIQVTGEVIDTWCHFSGVMGAGEAVQGTAHHTCARWCAAGGIPVGVLADDGTVYTLLKWQDQDPLTESQAILDVQSNRLTAEGVVYRRDGINYLIVETVISNEGIVNETHEIFGVTPHFAIPDPAEK